MPILIKDYTWRQTEEVLIIQIPIKGIRSSSADVFTSDWYLKIHSSPFMFEVCLWRPVVDDESVCTIDDEGATFKLVKKTPEEWPSLIANVTRQEALEIKKRALEESQERAKLRSEENKAKKNERQRAAVREQIKLSTQQRELIDNNRQQEKELALAQMGWSPSVTITEIDENKTIKEDKEIFTKSDSKHTKDKYIFNKADEEVGPGPRTPGQIPVTFTARWFSTPGRESQEAEEQQWLSKQAEARRRTGFSAEDLRPEERDPVWLCDKAKSFHDVGNYLGAISAYSHAVSLNSGLYELYSGRAWSHLALDNYNRALADSSKALELLTPPVVHNEEARARCHLCRGSALAQLGLTSQALGELNTARSLRPQDPDILSVLAQLEKQ